MLANSTPYLQAFGHVVLAWIWLDVSMTVAAKSDSAFKSGKLAAARYFFAYELPKIGAWLTVAAARESVCAQMHNDWF